MKNLFYTFFAISISLLLGKAINHLISGLPASLYGMILYAVFLQMNLFNADKVSTTNQWLIRNMGVCFVPAAIGIINHFQLMKQHGIALMGIIIGSTLILLTVIGYFSERILSKKDANVNNTSGDDT